MKIGIAGVGGIGSNVALNLVRSGISSLTIVDFDLVEASNLNRQFYFTDQIGKPKVEMLAINLLRINPNLNLNVVAEKITTNNIYKLFMDCEIIVEGFDSINDKKMLLEQLGDKCSMIVSASGIAGPDLANIGVRTLGNAHIIGDFTTDCRKASLYSHKVVSVAAKMTEKVLDHGALNARK